MQGFTMIELVVVYFT
ncbi:MAG: prepilin-type N-terminal cleavage/methylation domain-containing protein [Rhodocyclaceae bacterium]